MVFDLLDYSRATPLVPQLLLPLAYVTHRSLFGAVTIIGEYGPHSTCYFFDSDAGGCAVFATPDVLGSPPLTYTSCVAPIHDPFTQPAAPPFQGCCCFSFPLLLAAPCESHFVRVARSICHAVCVLPLVVLLGIASPLCSFLYFTRGLLADRLCWAMFIGEFSSTVAMLLSTLGR